MIKIASVIIILFGYIAISQEHLLRINKTAISLLLGVMLWVLATFAKANHVALALSETASEIIKTTDPSLWVLLALTTGVGGSILLIGSAPGIIAASIIKDMSFVNYLNVASIPAMLAFFAGVGVWYAQYVFLFLR